MSDPGNPIKPWESEYWAPLPLLRGEVVFCLASGPSLKVEDARKLVGRKVIVVNSSCYVAMEAGIEAPILYFTDSGWYSHRRDLVRDWPGLVVSMARLAKRELRDKVRRVKGFGSPCFPPRINGRPCFPPIGSPEIQQGRSSGHTAVSLAIAMGASHVVLLGYDMRIVAGQEHHHQGEPGYTGPRDLTLYEKEFAPGFEGWRAAAEASGVDVVNCTPDSAITEFRFSTLDEVLNG